MDLQLFYQDQVPAAVNSSFKFISINGTRSSYFPRKRCLTPGVGGLNNQSASEAGAEADLDVEFAFGIAFPTPATFWSTAGKPTHPLSRNLNLPISEGRPPFIPDSGTTSVGAVRTELAVSG